MTETCSSFAQAWWLHDYFNDTSPKIELVTQIPRLNAWLIVHYGTNIDFHILKQGTVHVTAVGQG